MPVLVSLLTIDIGAALASDSNLTTGNIVGLGVRYIILFIIGGVVAYLHEEEIKPFKLFELGIAAPALITSLITAQGITNPSPPRQNKAALEGISIIKTAYAGEESRPEKITLAGGFFSDVLSGMSGGVYRDIGKPVDVPHENIIEKPALGASISVIDAKQAKELPTEKPSENPKDIEREIMLLKARLKAAKASVSGKNENGNSAPLAESAKQTNILLEQAPEK